MIVKMAQMAQIACEDKMITLNAWYVGSEKGSRVCGPDKVRLSTGREVDGTYETEEVMMTWQRSGRLYLIAPEFPTRPTKRDEPGGITLLEFNYCNPPHTPHQIW